MNTISRGMYGKGRQDRVAGRRQRRHGRDRRGRQGRKVGKGRLQELCEPKVEGRLGMLQWQVVVCEGRR